MIKRLKISDPPSAVAERGTVLGGEGCSVDLACMVEGELITLDCVQVQQHKTKDTYRTRIKDAKINFIHVIPIFVM